MPAKSTDSGSAIRATVRKKAGGLWSVRVGRGYRALGLLKGDTMHWFWIGPHAEYERLLRS